MFARIRERQQQKKRLRAAQNNDVPYLCEALQSQPDLTAQFVQEGQEALDRDETLVAVAYCLALIEENSNAALNLIKLLAKKHHWSRISDKNAITLARAARQDDALYAQVAGVLSDKQFGQVWALLEGGMPNAVIFQAAKERLTFRRLVIDQWVIRQITHPAQAPAIIQELNALYRTTQQQFLQLGHYPWQPTTEELVRQIIVLAEITQQAPQTRVLQIVVRELAHWPSHGTACGIALLMQAPSPEWIEPLKDAWFNFLDAIVRDDERDSSTIGPNPVAPGDEMSASVLLTALGICAAVDPNYHNFEADEHRSQSYKWLVDERNSAVTQHNTLLDSLKQAHPYYFEQDPYNAITFEQLVRSGNPRHTALADGLLELRDLSQSITQRGNDIRSEQENLQNTWTPGYLLLQITGEGQKYNEGVRQGAAMGLHHLVSNGHLDEATREKIETHLTKIISPEDGGGERFRERRVLLYPGVSQYEMFQALRSGIQWMLEIAERGIDSNVARETLSHYNRLFETVHLLWRKLPQAVAFFTKHPLRLMRLDDKRKLGFYSQDCCSLELWTRYTPPKGIGKVQHRYLRVDDRTAPNAMGLHYRLLRHPFLSTPVLFHEYLHFAGTNHQPGKGILNEVDVWMRESLFARSLLMEHAPTDNVHFRAYMFDYFAHLNATQMQSFWNQMQWDFSHDDAFWSFQEAIIKLYGEPLDQMALEEKWMKRVTDENIRIKLANITQQWDPEIKFPPLGSSWDTMEVTNQFQQILATRWSQSHQLNLIKRDEILTEAQHKQVLAQWPLFLQRVQTILTNNGENITTPLSRPQND